MNRCYVLYELLFLMIVIYYIYWNICIIYLIWKKFNIYMVYFFNLMNVFFILKFFDGILIYLID